MDFVFDDGGRKAAGYAGRTSDCVVRAIAIATQKPYQEIYDAMNEAGANERKTKNRRGTSSARTGVFKPTTRRYMKTLGWTWVPTMFIGRGCKVHLETGELPMGRLIVSVSRHLTAVIDGNIHDTYDPRRNPGPGYGGRCVYGYFIKDGV